MKKYYILTAILVSMVVLFDCVFIFYLNIKQPNTAKESLKTLDLSGDPVNNCKNNFLSGGELCRIGDKLYFLDSGGSSPVMMQISSTGIKRLTKPKSGLFDDYSSISLYQSENSLYQFSTSNNELSSYDLSKNTFSKKLTLEDYWSDLFINQSVCYYAASNNNYSEYNEVETGSSYDVVMTNGNKKDVIIRNIDTFYETEKYIYYTQYNSESFDFVEYNKEMNNNRIILSLDNSFGNVSIGNFAVEGGYILFTSGPNNNILYKFKINSTGRPQKLFELATSLYFNPYGGIAYVYNDNNIFSVNIETEDLTTLIEDYEKTILGLYIVDNKWLYFSVNGGNELCRILQTGSDPEVVYK